MAAVTASGCGGGKQFANKPRPPAPVQLTGVIRDDKVTISPNKLGAGPVILLISNQSQEARTITLEGEDTEDTIGPVNPLDTAKLQQTLKEGSYTVKAGSEKAVAREIQSATVTVGQSRQDSSDKVLLP